MNHHQSVTQGRNPERFGVTMVTEWILPRSRLVSFSQNQPTTRVITHHSLTHHSSVMSDHEWIHSEGTRARLNIVFHWVSSSLVALSILSFSAFAEQCGSFSSFFGNPSVFLFAIIRYSVHGTLKCSWGSLKTTETVEQSLTATDWSLDLSSCETVIWGVAFSF